MFNKKSTRKVALIVLAIILVISLVSVVIPQISANTAKTSASEIINEEQPTDATNATEETEGTEATEVPDVTEGTDNTVEDSKPSNPVRNNEHNETQPTRPEVQPETQPETTEPETNPTEKPESETTEPEQKPTEPEIPEEDPAPTVHVHKYSVSNVVKATCTSSGYTTYVCECGHAYNGDATAPVEHEYTVEIIAPTVETEGYTLHTCKTCGKTKITDKTEKLPAPQAAPESKPAEHRHAEIVQGGVTYVFCSDITVPYAEPGYVYYPWSYYPF